MSTKPILDYSKGTVKVYLPDGRQSPRFNDGVHALAWIATAAKGAA